MSCFIPGLHMEVRDYHAKIIALKQWEDKGKLGKSSHTDNSIFLTELHPPIPKLLVLNIYKCVINEIVICRDFFFLVRQFNKSMN